MKPTDSPIFWVVGIVLTGLVGTWFRTLENKKTQRVKDLRSKIDSICEEMNDIEELAFKYFLKPSSDPDIQQDGLKIKTKLKRIATKVNAIHKDTTLVQLNGTSALTKLMHLRRAITLEDFDVVERPPLSSADPKFDKISSASVALKEVLEEIYSSNQ